MNEEEEEAIMEKLQIRMLPHTCETCGWMQPNLVPPLKGQKFCKYPGKIWLEGTCCGPWKLEPDPTKRSVGGKFVDTGF